MKKDKAHIQAEVLGVVIGWLRNESHIDAEDSRTLGWAQEIQNELAAEAELKMRELCARSKTFGA